MEGVYILLTREKGGKLPGKRPRKNLGEKGGRGKYSKQIRKEGGEIKA